MKEEEPMLQNQNSSTPTTHKIHLLKSDDTDSALTPHKRCATNVAVDDGESIQPEIIDIKQLKKEENAVDDGESIQPEIIDIKQLKKEENTIDDTKEEELPMSSTSFNGGLKEEESGREKLKRHRVEVAGQVGIPDTWGHEDLLKDWIDCSTFDFELVPKGIMSARASLAEQGRKEHSEQDT